MKNFNPDDWIPQEDHTPRKPKTPNQNGDATSVEKAIAALEEKQLDITSGYEKWCSLGFAFAHEYGESGRDYFHRISRMNSGYNPKKCDAQYSQCLKAKGSGISIATFFFYAKEAGIPISPTTPGHPEPVEGEPVEGEPVEGFGSHPEPVEGLGSHPEPVEGQSRAAQPGYDKLSPTGPQGHPEPVEDFGSHPEPVEGQSRAAKPGYDKLSLTGGPPEAVKGPPAKFYATPEQAFGSHPEPVEGEPVEGEPVEGFGRHPEPVEGQSRAAQPGYDKLSLTGPQPDFMEGGPVEESEEDEDEQLFEEGRKLDTLPDELFGKLPKFLREVVANASTPEERDALLLGTLTAVSSCLGNFSGYYGKHLVYPNLYLFITARASGGKGILYYCKRLVYPVHWKLREEAKIEKKLYEQELQSYNLSKDDKKKKPLKPGERMLLLPANSSSTGLFQLLHENKGQGFIFETEGDTLNFIFKTDYGNYSDGFRKAFHHEAISYFRRSENEHVEIEDPQLSTLLSGTPQQITSLIKSPENGLFSRFLYYYMNLDPEWRETFSEEGDEVLECFKDLSSRFLNFYQDLQEAGPINVVVTKEQKAHFFRHFSKHQKRYGSVLGDDYLATVRRMGLSAFRIMMILTAFRIMEWPEVRKPTMECYDRDFELALQITDLLLEHSVHVYRNLPQEKQVPRRLVPRLLLLELLPKKFSNTDMKQKALKVKISFRTAQRYVKGYVASGLVIKEDHGLFSKV